MKPVVGLIGGIGSGKSRVAEIFAEFGARVIEGDKLGHEGLRQPAIRDQVVARWGKEILGAAGEVDRKKLGAIVFADAEERRALEAIVLPYIERRIEEEIGKAKRDPAVGAIVLDAAILLEAGWDRFCDTVVFVDTPLAQRRERLARQRGWSPKEVAAREQAQLPLEEKAARADATIDNSGELAATRGHVERLLRTLQPALSQPMEPARR